MAIHDNRPEAPLIQNPAQKQSELTLPAPAGPRQPTHRKPPVTYPIRRPGCYQVREDTPTYDGKGGGSGKPEFDIDELGIRLVQFADELDWAVSRHDFHYRSIQALLGEGGCELSESAYQGLRSTQLWLRQRDQTLVASLAAIRTWLRESTGEQEAKPAE